MRRIPDVSKNATAVIRVAFVSMKDDLWVSLIAFSTIATGLWVMSFTESPIESMGWWLTFWAALLCPRAVVPIIIVILMGSLVYLGAKGV